MVFLVAERLYRGRIKSFYIILLGQMDSKISNNSFPRTRRRCNKKVIPGFKIIQGAPLEFIKPERKRLCKLCRACAFLPAAFPESPVFLRGAGIGIT